MFWTVHGANATVAVHCCSRSAPWIPVAAYPERIGVGTKGATPAGRPSDNWLVDFRPSRRPAENGRAW
jgi:hypothetical protein